MTAPTDRIAAVWPIAPVLAALALATGAAAAAPKPAGKTDTRSSKTDPRSDAKAGKTDPKASKTDAKPVEPRKADAKPSEPKAKPSEPKADAKPPAPTPAPAPAPAPAAGGYWVGAHLLGPGPGVIAATEAMSLGTSTEGAPATAGVIVGQTAALHDAVKFVARWTFAATVPGPDDRTIRQPPAPVPGGDLLARHGVVVVALTVQGRSADGSLRAIQWPREQKDMLPPELAWQPAALLPDRAPLFAAPAARVPPAGERYAQARRGGGLFVLGALDRCADADGRRDCLRWLQVVARDGERFQAGYLPAFQVALADRWQRGQGNLPRAQLIASGTRGDAAVFVLVARARDNAVHRLTLETPLAGDAFPEATLRVDGDWAVVGFAGAPERRIALDATMDARPR
jgi:hypothetical protein